MGLFGLSLPSVLALQSQSAAQGNTANKDTNVIVIWLDGGPSHIDTFDPKPDAPAEIRGEFGVVETNVKGVRISDQLPKVAQQMDKLSVLKLTSEQAGHTVGNHYMLTGYKVNPAVVYPSYGSVYSRVKGIRNGMPPYAIVGGPGVYNGGGYMGATFNPFNVGGDPNAEAFSVKDVTPPSGVSLDRLSRRREVLDSVDQFQREEETAQRSLVTTNQFYSRAFDLVTSPVAKKAFDIKQEPAKLRDEYGRHSFGQGCLLARRLIEAGTRFVTIHRGGWDTHVNNFVSLRASLPQIDSGYATLLRDLQDRGMLANTMVILMGELGRMPKVNSSAGRDHWQQMFVNIGGGPVKTGMVVGESDRIGEYQTDRPICPEDIAATVYKALGISLDTTFQNPDGRPMPVAQGGSPIHELF